MLERLCIFRILRIFLSLVVATSFSLPAVQGVACAQASSPMPVAFTAEQDQHNMMDQLGIHSLRPGSDADPKSAHYANYDEAKANPYPELPDALMFADGRKVTTADMWRDQRRPQLVEDLSRYVYGAVPAHVPDVTWSVVAKEREMVGFHPVIATELKGHVDNSGYPAIDVNLRMTLVLPADVKGPVPVLMMFGPGGFPAPVQPSPEDLERINTAMKALLVKQDPSLGPAIAQHPGWQPVPAVPFQFPTPNADGDPPSTWELIAAGWGFATLDPQSAQADNGAGLTRGIIGLVNKGQPRTPEQWGALRAWAWAAGRGLDYLATDPGVDAKHVGIEGVSRYGKAALVTMAFEARFNMALIGSSGKGGATPMRRNFGEAVENLTDGEYYWMAGNFLKYGALEATFDSMHADKLPVDSNELIALCAPRLTFISYGIPEKGDAPWLDQRGSWMATVAASPVWTLLGAPGLSTQDFHYQTAPMPKVNEGLLRGKLAWRQDDGGHTDAPNVKYFIQWADGFMGYKAHN